MSPEPAPSFNLSLGDWPSQQAGARPVRLAVFVEEQGVPLELEWDADDARSLHVVAHDEEGAAIGTGRLLPDGHVGRLAVCRSARGQGVGGAMLRALMEQARQRGDSQVVLHAQTQAEAFYVAHGFVRQGAEFMEAGIGHVRMHHVFA